MADAKCIVCGCSERRACIFGCSWASANPPVCDRCAGRVPYTATDEPDGRWHVVGPGPDGWSKRVLDVEVDDADSARKLAAMLNRVHLAGAKSALTVAKALVRKKLRAGD